MAETNQRQLAEKIQNVAEELFLTAPLDCSTVHHRCVRCFRTGTQGATGMCERCLQDTGSLGVLAQATALVQGKYMVAWAVLRTADGTAHHFMAYVQPDHDFPVVHALMKQLPVCECEDPDCEVGLYQRDRNDVTALVRLTAILKARGEARKLGIAAKDCNSMPVPVPAYLRLSPELDTFLSREELERWLWYLTYLFAHRPPHPGETFMDFVHSGQWDDASPSPGKNATFSTPTRYDTH